MALFVLVKKNMQKMEKLAKLKGLLIGKFLLSVTGSASIGWLVMLVHSPVMSLVLNTTHGFSFQKVLYFFFVVVVLFWWVTV